VTSSSRWSGPSRLPPPRSGGLDEQVTEEILLAAFIPFGDIVEVNIPKDFKDSECPIDRESHRAPL
jgi:hypothetical protein